MKNFSFFPIERNRYFYGKLLTVRDFEAEQNYEGAKHRLINRVVIGAGVVCGLGVTALDDATLLIGSGLALDYLGREIVVEDPLVRKLEMIEGCDKLSGRKDAYLCLEYDETDTEPVNAVGGTEDNTCFNMTREGYKMYFSTEAPEYRGLLEASGRENVSVLYSSAALTLVFFCSSAVCSGEEFTAGVMVIKNDKTPPVSFSLSGESAVVEGKDGLVTMEYRQSPEETRNVLIKEFKLKAQSLSDVTARLFPSGAELNIELGGHKYKNMIEPEAELTLCESRAKYLDYVHRKDDLAMHMRGHGIPIYLAKVELIDATDRVFLSTVTNMPFEQRLSTKTDSSAVGTDRLEVTTSVNALEFWQKPDVKASYRQESNALHLEFGIPSPELYDYTTSHGVVDIAMPGGIKVNGRYMSDEMPHGLGPGNVEVRLAVEFDNEGEAHLFGNSEVFRTKNTPVVAPWVETAVVVFPERGTMRIGIWLHDNVDGNRVRIHYYAQKPERDTKRLLENRQLSVSIVPEVSRLAKREQMRFKALVQGSEDKTVTWSVKDAGGGAIDKNGIYQAPETQGTYEIVATANADGKYNACAYVIVE